MKKVVLIFLIITAAFCFLNAEKTAGDEQKIQEAINSANNDLNNSLFKNALDKYQNILKYYTDNKNVEMINAFSYQIGVCYYYLADYRNALNYFLKTVEFYRRSENIDSFINLNNYLSYSYWFLRDYKNYIKSSEEMLLLYKKIDNKEGIASALINIAGGYYILEDYKKAKGIYNEAIKVSLEVKNEGHLAYIYNGVGNIYRIYGKFDLALEIYIESTRLSKKYKIDYITVLNLIEIGNLYFIWGNYKIAHDYYKNAYKLITEADLGYFLPTIYDKIARIYFIEKDYFSSIEYFKSSIQYAKQYNKPDETVSGLNSIGAVYHEWRKFDEALKYFNEALAYSTKNNLKGELGRIYIHIGNCFYVSGDYQKAVKNYKLGLKNTKERSNLVDTAVCLDNLGSLYKALKNYSLSIRYYNEAIIIKEELRKTAKGSLRRDYLSSQIKSFYALTEAYIFKNQIDKAFIAMEQGRTKYLIEEMSKTKDYRIEYAIDDNKILNNLKDDEILISFADININYYLVFTSSKKDMHCYGVEKANAGDIKEYAAAAVENQDFEKYRGIKKVNDKFSSLSVEDDFERDRLNELINYFITLLSKQNKSSDEDRELKSISKKLYNMFFLGMEAELKDKKTLLIIPDSILAYLPFEALIMPDGRYLVEKYDIKYIQSTAVHKLIGKRIYSPKNKSVLAFGGALYSMGAGNKKESSMQKPFSLNQKIDEELEDDLVPESSYNRLGLTWSDIPGSKEEVLNIKEIFQDTELYTGTAVNEGVIKNLSDSGKLSEYKIIHFATHGIVVPEEPELSALVLSNLTDLKEDNYLNTKEIADLKIEADFVNLSACETGLGKIYGGEGVAGLTQAFMIAGANSLSVSLWQVSDQSTMEFMSSFYKIISSGDTEFFSALSRVKREFIKSGKYSDPFYWACFVYYGK